VRVWCIESSKYLQLYPRQERKARIDWSTFKSVPNFPARSVNIPRSLQFSAIDAAGVDTEDFPSKHLRTWELRFALRHHVHVALARRDIAAGILDAILVHLRLIAT